MTDTTTDTTTTTSTNTPVFDHAVGIMAATGSVAAAGSIAAAAATAEKVVEQVMRVEPMVAGIAGMFVPGLSLVQPWIVMAAPFLERALTDIAANNGGDVLSAFMELLQHVSSGQPNSPVLAGVPTAFPGASSATADPSAQGSG
jgi:hypothetical protein